MLAERPNHRLWNAYPPPTPYYNINKAAVQLQLRDTAERSAGLGLCLGSLGKLKDNKGTINRKFQPLTYTARANSKQSNPQLGLDVRKPSDERLFCSVPFTQHIMSGFQQKPTKHTTDKKHSVKRHSKHQKQTQIRNGGILEYQMGNLKQLWLNAERSNG